jgi:hypothetical protein
LFLLAGFLNPLIQAPCPTDVVQAGIRIRVKAPTEASAKVDFSFLVVSAYRLSQTFAAVNN